MRTAATRGRTLRAARRRRHRAARARWLFLFLIAVVLGHVAESRRTLPCPPPAMQNSTIADHEREKYGCECDVANELERFGRPIHLAAKPAEPPRAPRGTARTAKSWDAEAAKRMLMNNLDPANAIDWENLVVYGGSGRAARNWHEYRKLVGALDELAED